MKYNLINATSNDIDYIKKSKLYNIFTYADDLPKDEIMRINNYVDEHIPVEITDYNSKSEEAYTFFKIVQNKLHYAITGHTAAELIYERADSEKECMGLTNWKNSPDGLIYKYDVVVAKNYLNEEEINNLKDLTNMFLIFAEDEAKQRHVMTMKNWIDATNDLLKFRRKRILNNSGSISHKEAIKKAENEYEKFRIKQDKEYISSMDEMYKRYLEESNK